MKKIWFYNNFNKLKQLYKKNKKKTINLNNNIHNYYNNIKNYNNKMQKLKVN